MHRYQLMLLMLCECLGNVLKYMLFVYLLEFARNKIWRGYLLYTYPSRYQPRIYKCTMYRLIASNSENRKANITLNQNLLKDFLFVFIVIEDRNEQKVIL